jgi:hypothetical protein
VVTSPMPRPKLPSALSAGAIEAAVVATSHAIQASTSHRSTRPARSPGAASSGRPSRAPAIQPTAVAPTRIGRAQAFGSS